MKANTSTKSHAELAEAKVEWYLAVVIELPSSSSSWRKAINKRIRKQLVRDALLMAI